METQFRSMQGVKEYLSQVPVEERYMAEEQVLQNILRDHNKSADLIEEIFLFVQHGGAFRAHITEHEFTKRWGEVINIIEDNKSKRDKVQEAKKAIAKRWKDDERVVRWLEDKEFSTNFLHAIRKLAGFVELDKAVRLVNAATIERLTSKKKWAKGIKAINSGDFDRAWKDRANEVQEVLGQQARELGMRFGICGFLEEIEGGGKPWTPEGSEVSGFSEPVTTFSIYTKKTYNDTPNWCNNISYKDTNSHTEGKVVFVLTD
jgi:hypothetical protein